MIKQLFCVHAFQKMAAYCDGRTLWICRKCGKRREGLALFEKDRR